MHIPWTTWTTACAILPLATAFYPYHPSPAGTKSVHSRRDARYAARKSLSLPVRRVPLRSRENQYDILKSAEPKGSNSVAVDQDGGDISYMAAVTIGSSKEEYYLLLDSAASNTWVMGGDCTSEACGKHNTFGKGDSDSLKTSSTPFSITYGTGSVSGLSATDTLHLGSLSTPLTFGLATNVSKEFSSYPMDGILGLGRGTSASQLDAPQLLEALAAGGLVKDKVYGVYLSRAADAVHDGELTIGGVNEELVDGDMNWVAAVDNDNGFWEVKVGDAGVGGTMVGYKGKSAIVDTGTSYMFLPAPDALALHKLIKGYTQSGETFTVPCDTEQEITIRFGDKLYGISTKDWVGGTTDGGCRSNIFGRKTFGDDQWLLGDVFLKNVYAGFDLDNSRVGFGNRKSSSMDGEKGGSSSSTSTGGKSQTSSGKRTTSIPTSAPLSPGTTESTPPVSETTAILMHSTTHIPPGSSPTSTANTATPTPSVEPFIPSPADPTSPPPSQNIAVQSAGGAEKKGGAGMLRVSVSGTMMMVMVWGAAVMML